MPVPRRSGWLFQSFLQRQRQMGRAAKQKGLKLANKKALQDFTYRLSMANLRAGNLPQIARLLESHIKLKRVSTRTAQSILFRLATRHINSIIDHLKKQGKRLGSLKARGNLAANLRELEPHIIGYTTRPLKDETTGNWITIVNKNNLVEVSVREPKK